MSIIARNHGLLTRPQNKPMLTRNAVLHCLLSCLAFYLSHNPTRLLADSSSERVHVSWESLADLPVGASSASMPRIGINGHYRVGYWTAIRLDGLQPLAAKDSSTNAGRVDLGSITIETTDGDGAVVRYRQPSASSDSSDHGLSDHGLSDHGLSDHGLSGEFAYAIPGSEAAPLIVSQRDEFNQEPIVDDSGLKESQRAANRTNNSSVLWKSRFPESGVAIEGPAMIPVGMPWVVVFGEPLGIESIGANELLKRAASVAVTNITDPTSVPDHELGLHGVDMVLVTTSGHQVLSQLTRRQQTALSEWVLAGGRLMVTLGEHAHRTLEAAPWIAKLLPDSLSNSEVTRLSPAGLETFTSSQTRLLEFSGLQLPKDRGQGSAGRMLIAGRTTRRVSVPLASRFTVGLGTITAVAANLEADTFAEWPQRLDLVTKIADQRFALDDSDVGSSMRISGYADLAGQTRRTLDRFDLSSSHSFSVVALIIGLLIAFVGPLDFLLVRKVLGRPLLGWLTFPLVATLMSVMLWWAAQPNTSSPGQLSGVTKTGLGSSNDSSSMETPQSPTDPLLRANSLEFLDVDAENQIGRLFRWSYLYSHPARVVDVSARVHGRTRNFIQTIHHQTVRPFGTPGVSMGGIQIEASTKPLVVPLTTASPRTTASSQEGSDATIGGVHSSIQALELPPRSSKSLALSMQFTSKLNANPVKRRPGAELLAGSLANPLGVDLLEGMLIYQNWVYLLPTRFPADGVIDQLDSLRQKNFRWQLSRQRALESSSESETWDVTRTNQPDRIAEMLMFHQAVGGARYTTLKHEVLGHLDLSNVLTDQRCILVGKCRNAWSELTVQDESGTIVDPPGERTTWVRVVLPVVESRR